MKFHHQANLLLFLFLLFADIQTPLLANNRQGQILSSKLADNIPEIPQRIKDRMRQYQNVRAVNFRGWDPKGPGILITTRFGDVEQLHYVAKPGGSRRQITFFEEPVYFGTFCPDTSQPGLLFTKDIGGNENYQIFYHDFHSGNNTLLTDGTAKYGAPVWSNQGKQFAYFSTKRNGTDWDVYIHTGIKPENSRLIIQKEGVWAPLQWSPDDKKIVVMNYKAANESYLYVYDITNKTLTPVNKKNQKIAYGLVVWAHQGKGLFYTSNDGTEFLTLQYYDFQQAKTSIITDDLPWNIIDLAISWERREGVFVTNEHGMSNLYIFNTKTLKHHKIPNLPIGRIYGLEYSPDNAKISLVIASSKNPGDVFSLDLTDTSLTRWTFSEIGGLNEQKLVNPEVFYYPTFDSVASGVRKIPALRFNPQSKKPPYPVLIHIHGGPESQFWPQYKSGIQYYINELGITVIGPNVRGSAGYGKTYMDLDNGKQRWKAIKDIGALIDWIARQPDLDANRIGVIGSSYGGFMTLSAMVHYHDRLTCAIDIYGISNFVSFLQNTKKYRRDLRRAEYGDERDPSMKEFLLDISPFTHHRKISKPIFILQGANDPRVPVTESEQMVKAIRSNNGTVWYFLAQDEGHGFGKKINKDFKEQAIVLFLETYLLKRGRF